MTLRPLRCFCVVAGELNLTKTAEKLFIAQHLLTRKIKHAKEYMGVINYLGSFTLIGIQLH
jgi:DNA-binding transcriptional LysR family regulator